MYYFVLIFFTSLVVSGLILKLYEIKFRYYFKSPEGPQKIHKGSVSRLGGLSIYLTLIMISSVVFYEKSLFNDLFFLYFLTAIPIFIMGFMEDVTQVISPKLRILSSLLSGFLFVLIFNIFIKSVGINFIDTILNYKIMSFIFTILCITFLTQAFNIIDGLNGLCLSTAILVLLSVSIISFKVNDDQIFYLCISFISIFLGVLAFNFPLGKLFLGDSGAYIVGFFSALTVILLITKNTILSPFVIAQILIYPSYELLRSFVRRFLFDRKVILKPDRKHLHSVLYTYNLNFFSFSNLTTNNITSLQIIFLQIVNVIFIITYYDNEKAIIYGIIFFLIIYEILYNLIIKKLR
jgi:UDP-N-acetylmuramyl pentapeptide phosphotransferase/UDP-N-acetylglucosamine-1-phosphate transferase